MVNALKILSEVSEVAHKYYRNGGTNWKLYNVIEDEQLNTENVIKGNEIDFHPNGKSGCILLDDDYFFGIRCDHLMWMEGFCECSTEDTNGGVEGDNSIMLIGNHKGALKIKILAFKPYEEEATDEE